MTTKALFLYIIALLTSMAVLFGFIPPLLNAKSTLLNSIGVALALIILVTVILTTHATIISNNQPTEKSDNKEQ